jgi:hypothetical protein
MPNGDVSGNNRSPSWKSPFMPATLTTASCKSCHGFPPSSHGFTAPATFPAAAAACKSCHSNINAAGTTYADIFVNKSLHINRIVEGGGCNGCHGYPPSNKRFIPKQNNWSSARMENYSGGGGAHTIAGHVSPTANPNQQWANCTNCHNQNDHATSPLVFTPSSNIKVNIDQKFKFDSKRTAKYIPTNKLDGNAHIPGNCSNVSCHFQKTPQW